MSSNSKMSSNKKKSNDALQVATLLAASGHRKNAAALTLAIPGLEGDVAFYEALQDEPGSLGRTRLMYAAHTGDMARVRFLLARGADPNVATVLGKTALMFASQMGYDDILLELCSTGHPEDAHPHPTAVVDAKDSFGITALMYGSSYVDCINVLCDKGANIHLTSNDGNNALMRLQSITPASKAAIRELVRRGININARDSEGKTALFMRISERFPTSKYSDSDVLDLVRLLIELGADVNLATNTWETPLMEACRNNVVGAATLLCDKGANLNAVEQISMHTALIYATSRNNKECVKLLCDRGADLNLANVAGHTSVHIAVWIGSINCLRILGDAGADLNVEDNRRKTPLMWAAMGHLLRNAEIGYSETRTNCLRILCEHGANVDQQSIGGFGAGPTAAMFAAEKGYDEELQILKDHGADLNLADGEGRNPLYVAVERNHKNCVTLLCKLGVQMDVPSTLMIEGNPEYTPLMVAAEEGYFDLVKILCSYGAHGGWENEDGDSAITLARTDEIRKYIEHDIKSPAGKLLSYLPLPRFEGGKRQTRRWRWRRQHSKKRKTRAH